jgi:ADP-dependent NAD(P)H-hydrate dehydratase
MPIDTPPEDLVRLPPRGRQASKRDHGRVVIAGGAPGMAGAPALAAMAALKSGAGLVELMVPDSIAPIAAAFDPCVMTRGLPAETVGGFDAAAGVTLATRLTAADAAAVGPGMGRTAAVRTIVARLWREALVPIVFDADALWALSPADRGLLREHAGPRVLTPHAGELARLLGRDPVGVRDADRPALEEAAAALAAELDVVVVFKGAGTLVVARDRQARNETGNPGMATAGTGDVLAGVIAALLGQGLGAFDAARLGAWVHGRAGDAAAADLGQVSMTARDLLDRLHVGFRACSGGL